MKSVTILLSVLLLTQSLTAALTFKQPRVIWDAPVGTREMKTDFTFTNTGEKSVEIIAITTKCDCTVASLEKKTYLPGESGVISATFTFGDREGEQKKTILVTTDVPGSTPIELDMVANIPPLLDLNPKMLFWRRGEAGEAKELRVQTFGEQFSLVQNPAVAEHFTFELLSQNNGTRIYNVRPVSTSEAVREDINFSVEDGNQQTGDNEKEVTIRKRLFLMIR